MTIKEALVKLGDICERLEALNVEVEQICINSLEMSDVNAMLISFNLPHSTSIESIVDDLAAIGCIIQAHYPTITGHKGTIEVNIDIVLPE